ncbi:redoxin domain-containing protein [Roseimicrobium sp. ORNL1]|uniref:peroxiredoxin family protein n=1 Tax=Roseimicrobium sp. ORNL1 TaxID=2711231 RepID=UPI0013E1823A|nr:redoxin domain-containing protein [Roseimicrobium sp. ORNL1]QIF05912.1 redoxin domain-containing protein [Roseimicrobium sp. ORNL1]
MDFSVLASCCLLLLACVLSPAALSAAGKSEPVQCLSALAWQREQDYVKPANDEAAFRGGPFALPKREDAKPLPAGLSLPVTASISPSTAVDKAEVELRIAAGVRALHAFADGEAECWFRDAARLDPQCAAAWLGLAMANEKLPSRALYFLEKAKVAQAQTPHEGAWMAAYDTFFQTSKSADLLERLEKLSGELQKLADAEGKEDRCAASFALRYRIIRANIARIPLSDAQEIEERYDAWTREEGGDALVFYPVLLWLKFDAAKAAQHTRALIEKHGGAAAWRLAAEPKLALGNYKEAAACLGAALSKAMEASSASSSEKETTILEYATALAWCQFHGGHPSQAVSQASELVGLPRKPGFTGLEAVDDAAESGYLGALQLRAQMWMASGNWVALADDATAAAADAGEKGLLVRAHQYYWAALASAALSRGKEWQSAKADLGKVAEEIARTPYLTRHAEVVSGYVRGAEAFGNLVQGRITPFMKDIAHVPGFVLAPWMSKAGAATAAQAMVDNALKEHPGSEPLLHVASVLKAKGSVLDEVQVPGIIYGPYHRELPAQPAVSLPDKSGAVHALAEFKGRPVLVIFFLGQGCAHCVEQLQKFRPLVGAYEQAGIPIVAIGTDSVEKLAESLGPGPERNPDLPYLILSDEPMAAFKAWKCYDEFLQKPLHGTFLLDAGGSVLWSDISHDPYTQASYLLGECQRLLKLHGVVDGVVGVGAVGK